MKIYREICDALRNGKSAVLATIVAAAGSTPAPADSKMLVFTNPGEPKPDQSSDPSLIPGVVPGRMIGTIGGGCLDASIVEIASAARTDFQPQILSFNLNDDIGDTGLNCGGRVDVLLEAIDPRSLLPYETALSLLESGDSCFIVTTMHQIGNPGKSVCSVEGDLLAGESLPQPLLDLIRSVEVDEVDVRRMHIDDVQYVVEHLSARPRVLIFGGGHVGRSTGRCASLAGFHVTVIDDRPSFANASRFPEADAIVCEPFDQIFSWLKITPAAYVVIVTRGHKHDALILEKVLQFKAKYVGMIGSRRKVLSVYEQMREKGIPEERFAGVHAPVGLDIGAVTPDEIGVAIVAEMIAVRRGVQIREKAVGSLMIK